MTFAELKDHVSMLDVVELFGVKEQRGRYLCPFHNDHNPSAVVKGERFKCYACNWHGDIVDFARDMGMDISTLAASFGLEWQGERDLEAEARAETERQERKRIRLLKAEQTKLVCQGRCYFWGLKHEEDWFPIAYLDRLLDGDKLPVAWDVDVMLTGLVGVYSEA